MKNSLSTFSDFKEGMFIKNKHTCTIYLVTKNKRKWKLGFYREILLTGYYVEFDMFSKNYQKIIREEITIENNKSKNTPIFYGVDSWTPAKISEIFHYKILQMSFYKNLARKPLSL